MRVWVAADVRCAECAGGDSQLLTVLGVYPTFEGAKLALEPCVRGEWSERDGGGAYAYESDGGVEIFPIAYVE